MTTKLVSMNLGVRLELVVDGKPKLVEWSAVCPSGLLDHPTVLLDSLAKFLNDNLNTGIAIEWDGSPVSIAKPRRIKARRPLSHDEYNRRIAELGK